MGRGVARRLLLFFLAARRSAGACDPARLRAIPRRAPRPNRHPRPLPGHIPVFPGRIPVASRPYSDGIRTASPPDLPPASRPSAAAIRPGACRPSHRRNISPSVRPDGSAPQHTARTHRPNAPHPAAERAAGCAMNMRREPICALLRGSGRGNGARGAAAGRTSMRRVPRTAARRRPIPPRQRCLRPTAGTAPTGRTARAGYR